MKIDDRHNIKLQPSIELFSGAGGLALGLEESGFEHYALVEWDRDSCDTMRVNKAYRGGWTVYEMDARTFDYRPFVDRIGFVAGGPPCQPFSLGGKHRAYNDERDMFPEAVRAIRELRPKAFLFENVKGLTRQSFSKYFGYIILQLTHPEIVKKSNEDWLDHLSRLENHHTRSKRVGLDYNVVFRVLNAADYGIPQKRERVIIVGFRKDLGVEWAFPEPTHSLARLRHEQSISMEYWERHGVVKKLRTIPEDRETGESATFDSPERLLDLKPWATVRDALSGLPDPESKNAKNIPNHVYVPGARKYPGHTGSHIDLPAKTIKAGGHGVPGGENMLLKTDGSVRYFTTRESARLQTFPDSYIISGSWTESMRQLGNAVPVSLARILGESIQVKIN